MSVVDYRDKIAYSQSGPNKVVLAETDNARSTLWCLLPGQHIHPHVHAGDHIWVVFEGEGHLLGLDDEPQVKPGDTAFLPAGQSHGIDNRSQHGLVFLSISAGS